MLPDKRTFSYELNELKQQFNQCEGKSANENMELFYVFCMNIISQKSIQNQEKIALKLQNIEEQLSLFKASPDETD